MKTRTPLRVIGIIGSAMLIATLTDQYGARPWMARAHAADNVTVESIANALKQRKTRGMKPERSTEVLRDIEDLKRIRKTRGWNMHDRARLAKATQQLAQIDLEIYFDFDSANISPQAEPVLDKLGQALARDEYKGRTFVLAGHTDAKGSGEYNQNLSERRAEAVKRYIAERFKLPPEDLLTVGHGFEQLKNTQNPMAGENRRVQIVNFNQ